MNAAAVGAGVPAGYVALDPRPPGTAAVVCRADAADAVRDVVARWGTLYAYAAAHPARRELRGRAAAYAVPLGAGGDGRARAVVVRHGWRGGALRRVRRDLFFPPTRAPLELATSERLRAAGVPTPSVIAYAVYPAPAGLRRVDVATALVPDGVDLAALLVAGARDPSDASADAWVRPTAALLVALARAGARHPDLNLKNVLLAPAPAGRVGPGTRAWVLDVDVARVLAAAVAPAAAAATLAANVGRLARSVRKWAGANVAADDRARLDTALHALGERARGELARAEVGALALPAPAAPARA